MLKQRGRLSRQRKGYGCRVSEWKVLVITSERASSITTRKRLLFLTTAIEGERSIGGLASTIPSLRPATTRHLERSRSSGLYTGSLLQSNRSTQSIHSKREPPISLLGKPECYTARSRPILRGRILGSTFGCGYGSHLRRTPGKRDSRG